MAERDPLQVLAAEALTFFEWVGSVLGDPVARAAVIKDLGGDPGAAGTPVELPADRLDALRAFRDATNPTLEAGVSTFVDLAAVLDVVASNVEAWGAGGEAQTAEAAHSLLELLASNFFRLRFPRAFMVLQAVSVLEELTSTYGQGTNNLTRLGSSLKSLLLFLLQPGKSLAQLDGSGASDEDRLAVYTDFGFRLAGAVVGVWNGIKDLPVITDVLTGWDGPGIDIDSPVTPSRADVISQRMTTVALGYDRGGGGSTDPATSGRLFVTTAMVPKSEGGTALFLSVGGAIELEQELSRRWTLSVHTRSDGAVSALIGSQFRLVGPNVDSFSASVGLASNPPAPTPQDPNPSPVTLSVPSAHGTRLDLGRIAVSATLVLSGAELLLTLDDAAVVIDPEDQDGFMAELLGDTPLRLPFRLVIGYSTSRGLVVEGSAPPAGATATSAPLANTAEVGPPVLAVTVPVGRSYGPVTVHEVAVRVARGPVDVAPRDATRIAVEADLSFSATLGPVYLRVDQLGLSVVIDDEKPPAQRNLRFLDLRPGIKFPRGIAVNIETALIAGGGSIFYDPLLGLYFGTLELAFRGGRRLQAIALVTTHQADGTKGSSMLVILTMQLTRPYPLGMGFFLDSVGGMLAFHRTFDETAMRAALPTGQLRNVLFPNDPVHHAAEILHSIQALFPARRGSHLAGLLAKITWFSPPLVVMNLALLYEWGNRQRLILLGRVSALLPTPDNALLALNMDAVGVLDLDEGTFALDAALYDSRLCGRFVLTGAMAMRMSFGNRAAFALAVGGLHPRFPAPEGFPNVGRLQLALTNGDNPKLVCSAYLALTSNTVQFGADCSLYAAAFGFAIVGNVGFDVLISLLPFHFLAEFRASVQLKRGSRNLFKVAVSGELEGPLPLRIAGRATFEILWCDYSVSFDATLVAGEADSDLPAVDALASLMTAVGDPGAWSTAMPAGSPELVTVRQGRTNGLLLHPLGVVTVRESVVPLNLSRDIDRVGPARPTGDRRFSITRAALGTAVQTLSPLRELFAPAQYFDLSDDDKLAAPSFESMAGGVTFGDGGYLLDVSSAMASPFDYTDIVVNDNGTPVPEPDGDPMDATLVIQLSAVSPAATSAARRAPEERFAGPVLSAAPSVRRPGWVAAEPSGPPPADAVLTWAEARALTAEHPERILVPRSELGG